MKVDRPSSSHIKILGLGKSSDGGLFLEVEISLQARVERRVLSLVELEASPDRAIRDLGAALVTVAARREFLERAQGAFKTMRPTFRVVTRPGWCGRVFVFPDGSCVPDRAGFRVCIPADIRFYGESFGTRGSLAKWRRIAVMARGNSRLMLALALAFCGPVVDLLGLEAPGFQIFGPPGSAKSAIGIAAGSVWGGDADGLFPQGWNNTVNNLERLAGAHHATFLVLDETREEDQPQPSKTGIFRAVMRLAGGRMKGRLQDTALALRGQTPKLSTSNESLDELALRHREKIDDAHRDRLVDVPPVSGILGAFEQLHGFAHHGVFGDALIEVARENHGVAATEFLRRLGDGLARDEARVVAWLKGRHEYYARVALAGVSSPSRDLLRLHQRFATVYAAGCLAIWYGILPWSREELLAALLECERAHVAHVAQFVSAPAPHMPAEPKDPVAPLRDHERLHRALFVILEDGLLDPASGHDHDACDGYVHRRDDGALEYLFSEAKLREVCGGKAAALEAKRRLDAGGWLVRDGARLCTRRTIWASGDRRREQVVAVLASAFDGESR